MLFTSFLYKKNDTIFKVEIVRHCEHTSVVIASVSEASSLVQQIASSFLLAMAARICVTHCLVFLFVFINLNFVSAQTKQDSIRHLKNIEINARRTPELQQLSTPTQTLNSMSLEKLNGIQLSDAVKHFSGVTVKDYGGIGGLKTVSIRSLGTQQTGVSYDGIVIANAQNGQIDLGKFSLDQIDEISLSNAQADNIFQTARSFASAGILNITTSMPRFAENKKTQGTVSFKGGSFGFINPAFTLQQKISNKVAVTLSADYQQADGEYPFTLDYGGNTSEQYRNNSDMQTFRAESGLYAQLDSLSKLWVKMYYYQSERGLPGATVFYNLHSSQRLWDRDFFIQSCYETCLLPALRLKLNAKYDYTYTRYLDPDYLNISGKQENIYKQDEYYLSAAGSYFIAKHWEASLASDMISNTLDANIYAFAYPVRWSSLSAAAIKYTSKHFDAQGSLLYTFITDKVETGETPENRNKLSPALIMALKPFNKIDFQFRAFYKNVFRMPSFNDLYYTGIGNTNLRPENAQQFNVGVAFTQTSKTAKQHYISVSVDAYHNRVTDKIIAIPTKNLFTWSMMNLGKVYINGIDVALKAGWDFGHKWYLSCEAAYTYQQALDKTDPDAKTYDNQIAYTPFNSGSGNISLEMPWLKLSYNVLMCGQRYALNHNTRANLLEGYTEHSLLASRCFKIKSNKLKVNFEIINLLNTQYEVVRNFPMPGRSFRAGASWTF